MAWFERMYERMPVWGQNLACSWYGLQQQRRFYGGRFNHYLEQYRVNERRTWAELQMEQLSRLRLTLDHACRDVPYYRQIAHDLHLDPNSVTWETFRKLPLLEKECVRENPESFYSARFPPSQIVVGRTSGTTGTPLVIRISHDAAQQVWAAMERMRIWAGVSRFHRRASLTGKVFVPTSSDSKGIYWRYDLASRRILLSVYHLNDDTVASYVAALQRFRPAFIDGYPSAINRIAEYVQCHPSERIESLVAAFPTAETLTPDMRSTIQDGLVGARVFNQYGSTESACHISECCSGRLHVSPEIGIVEILDEQGVPVAPGGVGEIVITGLVNEAMPLIRYRIGDTAVAADPALQCECGSPFPVVDKLVGRTDDLVHTDDGRALPIMNYHVFKWAKGVQEAQLIQESYDTFTIIFVAQPEQSIDLSQSLRELDTRMGKPMNVKIQQVDQIERTRAGKFRGVVSHIK